MFRPEDTITVHKDILENAEVFLNILKEGKRKALEIADQNKDKPNSHFETKYPSRAGYVSHYTFRQSNQMINEEKLSAKM